MIICWWSGGITSAVACKKAIELFGVEQCRVIMIDTKNEHSDTYRFKDDCSKWYGAQIESITGIGDKYSSIADVWDKYSTLNVAFGAVCSSELKGRVRERWQKTNDFEHQVFGFELTKKEAARALALKLNHPGCKPVFPLLMLGLDKQDCIKIVSDAGIKIPDAYALGYSNNNCLQTGCVQGGIGYWQKIERDSPVIFDAMAEREHRYTNIKGKPVTMLKDQSKAAKESGTERVFLRAHPDYPDHKSLGNFKPVPVKSLVDCSGFCGTYDLDDDNPTTEHQLVISGL